FQGALWDGDAVANLVAFPDAVFWLDLFLGIKAKGEPFLAEGGNPAAQQVEGGTDRVRGLPGGLFLPLQFGPEFGEVFLRPLELVGACFTAFRQVSGSMVEKSIALAPVGSTLLRHAPGHGVPDEIRDLFPLVVEEADSPGVRDLAGQEPGTHE